MDISKLAETQLRSNSYLALKNISCEYDHGVLILRGSVPTYHLKQIAQESVAQVVGVEWIDNQIEVLIPQ
jgi:osmotically-inducible protein OsmY